MNIIIKEVTNIYNLRKFVTFNIRLYKGHPYHVPGLIEEELITLRKDKNPAFEFCESIYFLAYKNGKIVGRIAGIINHRANNTWNQMYARFGFVDFIDDFKVSKLLFDSVEQWAKSKGMKSIQGPLGFSDLDHEGLLVWGFDQVGTMATSYSFSYYIDHLIYLKYYKDQDWKEFKIQIPKNIPERHRRISEIVLKKYGLKIVKCKRVKELQKYTKKIFYLWNEAYRPLYGYSELSDRQIDYYIKMYMPILRLKMITLIVRELDDVVIGVGVTLPNLSRALQKAKGKLFPFGWIYLLKALYWKGEVVDLYIVGIHPEYQNKGINALFFYDLIPIFNQMGFMYAESNPELELNLKIQSQWNYFKTQHIKTRRSFIKHF